jgi:hypothetical protein
MTMNMTTTMITITAIIIEHFDAGGRQNVRPSDETRPKAPETAAARW